jgi:hypothetical protein
MAIEWGSTVLNGHVTDIGPDGLFIKLPNPLWIGAAFSGQLTLDRQWRIDCVVRWIDSGRGMGVSFFIPDEEGRKWFGIFLDRLAGNN